MPSVLAIDPGSAKCGIAVVDRQGEIVFRGIVRTEALVEVVRAKIAEFAPVAVVIGNGTGSKPLRRAIEEAELGLPIQSVEEAHTSEAARARYVAENAPRGWQRLLPRALRTPDTPYDDYVAVILAERYWEETADFTP